MFFIFPLTLFGLSMAGPIPLYIVVTTILITIIFCVIVNKLQDSAPRYLPTCLLTWDFLPLWLHSFEPWDAVVMSVAACCCRRRGWESDGELKQVIVNSKTPADSQERDLDKLATMSYNTLPIARLVSRQRSSSTSHSFSLMMETNYTYNKLPPAHKIFSPPSPLIEKLLPVAPEPEDQESRESVADMNTK